MSAQRRKGLVTEVLEINLQSGSDDEGDDTDVEIHDKDSESDLFQDFVDSSDEGESTEAEDVESPAAGGVSHDATVTEISDWECDGGEAVDDDCGAREGEGNAGCGMDIDVEEADVDDRSHWIRSTPVDFPATPHFEVATGLQVNVGDDPQPIDIYRLFLNDEILYRLKMETNTYARSCIEEKRRQGPLPPRSMFATWKNVTMADLKNFLAICLHIGIVRKPHIINYWSLDPAIHTSYAAQIMSRDRFKSILAFLHVNNNVTHVPFGQENHDPIHKIRPLVEHLQNRFQAVYVPEKEMCVHEVMCPFKGRSRFKVYMREKRTQWGFKFYELCESRSGYVYRFEMFCRDKRYSNRPYDVVMRLMAPLLNKGYQLYMDNYYCEPRICAALAKQGTMVCGTVRKKRLRMIHDLLDQPMRVGQLDFRRCAQVVACRWRDKRDVLTLSTMHRPELQSVQCRSGQKQKPTSVIEYIRNMAGVDRSDQMRAYFPMHRNSLKWWKKPFFYLLTLCTIQTMIVLNRHRKQRNLKKMPLDGVIRSLLKDLPTVDVEVAEGAGPFHRLPALRLSQRHFPSRLPQDANRRKALRRNCVVCYAKQAAGYDTAKKVRLQSTQRTPFWCRWCQKALCVDPCFELFHTRKDYAVP